MNNWPGMTVIGDMAYLADGASIYGVNLTNGTQKWVFPERQQSGGIIESLFPGTKLRDFVCSSSDRWRDDGDR